jgi:ketopantoate reductase
MRFLIVGAGSVGCVLGAALEQTKGNTVTYLVRKGRKAELTRIKLLQGKTMELKVRERPSVIEQGQVLPAVDAVLYAVRADQLEAALADAPPPASVAIISATAGVDDVAMLRARHPDHKVVQILNGFLAYPDGDAIRWWQPGLSRTIVSYADDEGSKPLAEELVTALTTGGLPSKLMHSVLRERALIAGLEMPLWAALELAGSDVQRLGADRELRRLAGAAAREGVRAMGDDAVHRLLSIGARPLVAVLVRALPLVAKDAVEMLRVHTPKIAQQTRRHLEMLRARADDSGRAHDSLDELARRLGETGHA